MRALRTILVTQDESPGLKILSLTGWFSHSVATPWTVAHQAPLSMGLSRPEYWSELPSPPPGIFPTQESNPGLLHYRQILYLLNHQRSPFSYICRDSFPKKGNLHRLHDHKPHSLQVKPVGAEQREASLSLWPSPGLQAEVRMTTQGRRCLVTKWTPLTHRPGRSRVTEAANLCRNSWGILQLHFLSGKCVPGVVASA